MNFKTMILETKEKFSKASLRKKMKISAIVVGSIFALLIFSIVGTYAFFSHRLSAGYIPIVEAPAIFYEVTVAPVVEEVPMEEVHKMYEEVFEEENNEYVAHEGYDYIFEREEIDERIFSFLFIGDDARIHEDRGRSDALMIATFNRDTGEIFFTSIMRDTFVPLLDESNSWHRINHAYRAGGAGRAINVINNAFSLDIQHYVTVRFADVFVLTDNLGGLNIELRHDEVAVLNSIFPDYESLTAGTNLLNGRQVLAFSRMRMVDGRGDRGRVVRQQQVMRAIIERVLSANSFSDIIALADFSLNHMTTNIPLSTIITLAYELFMARNLQIHELRVPVDSSFRGVNHQGSSVLQMNFETNIRTVHEFIFGTSEGIRIPVVMPPQPAPPPTPTPEPEPEIEIEIEPPDTVHIYQETEQVQALEHELEAIYEPTPTPQAFELEVENELPTPYTQEHEAPICPLDEDE